MLRGEPQRPQNIIGGSKVVAKEEMLKKKSHILFVVLSTKRGWFNVSIVLSRQY